MPKPFDVTTYVLMGLRYSGEDTELLLRGVRVRHESVTFQAILSKGREQGRLQEAINLLFKLGRKQFGAPSASIVTFVEQITDLNQIEQLHERLLDVKTWNELLAPLQAGNGKD